ncbi:recombinase family protein [Bradyrhizobium sp. 187]|uniref:recombinase family protein n=1 Tax=Bradyrhizobium sp. 187 TaxID=2782655 RepID=UPI002000362D|nr:recombinase family protein [Bradyrhizobium sp. 187]
MATAGSKPRLQSCCRWRGACASSNSVLRWPVLKNPAYAGAFVYGRTRFRPPRREGALPQKAQRAIEEWRIVVKDRYPPYIDWPNL